MEIPRGLFKGTGKPRSDVFVFITVSLLELSLVVPHPTQLLRIQLYKFDTASISNSRYDASSVTCYVLI
jgi:hypothetical protein